MSSLFFLTGGKVEQSSQTDWQGTTNRGVQTVTAAFTDVCIKYLQNRGYSVFSPETTAASLRGIRCSNRSLDDLVVDVNSRVLSRNLIETSLIEVAPSSKPPSRATTPRAGLVTPRAVTPTGGTPEPGTSSTISASFRAHQFYPEKREGRGPKKIRTDLDKSFAITSEKVVSKLKKEMEDKKAKMEKKQLNKALRGRGGCRGRGGGRKRNTPPTEEASSSSDEENDDVITQIERATYSDEDVEELLGDSDQLCVKVRYTFQSLPSIFLET